MQPHRARHARACVLGLISVLAAGAQAHAQNAPFDRLLGAWGGNGQIRMEGGQTERISCNAYYTGSDAQLGMAIRCASPSYSIEMRSRLNYARGRVTGRWEERTFNAEGNVTGQASDEKMTLEITGPITGSLSLTYNRNQQMLAISTEGSPLKNVSISLSRR